MTDEARALTSDCVSAWAARLVCCVSGCFLGAFRPGGFGDLEGDRQKAKQPDAPSTPNRPPNSAGCGRPFPQCRKKVEERLGRGALLLDRCRNNRKRLNATGGSTLAFDLCTRSQPDSRIPIGRNHSDLPEPVLVVQDLGPRQCGHSRCECQTAFLEERSRPNLFPQLPLMAARTDLTDALLALIPEDGSEAQAMRELRA